jgi:hypothetical protein
MASYPDLVAGTFFGTFLLVAHDENPFVVAAAVQGIARD